MSIKLTKGPHMQFSRFVPLVPTNLLKKSGEVFYTGKRSFEAPSSVCLLGLNPGSDNSDETLNTVEQSLRKTFYSHPLEFSRYEDERWNRASRTYTPMQVRVKHLLNRIGVEPRNVPSSNLVFPRSPDANSTVVEFDALAEQCWPLHDEVVTSQGVKVVICMGGMTFEYVARNLGAKEYLRDYVETNRRRWRSIAHRNSSGVIVVGLTHPSRADWTSYHSDPSGLVK